MWFVLCRLERPGLNAILTVIRLLKTPSWLEKQKNAMQKAKELQNTQTPDLTIAA